MATSSPGSLLSDLSRRQPPSSVPGASAIHGIAGRNGTYVAPHIFVVDDEPVIASTLAAILRLNGYSTTFFTSPFEALTAAKLKAPDLVISDVAMPGISGIDMAILMKAEYPECRVLLFSGQAETADLLCAAREEGHDFQLLSKPIHPSAMLAKIQGLVVECGPRLVVPAFAGTKVL